MKILIEKECFYASGKGTDALTRPDREVLGENLESELSATENRIISVIAENKWITMPEIALKVGVSERTIERSVKSLKDLGQLKRQGSTKPGYWEIQ